MWTLVRDIVGWFWFGRAVGGVMVVQSQHFFPFAIRKPPKFCHSSDHVIKRKIPQRLRHQAPALALILQEGTCINRSLFWSWGGWFFGRSNFYLAEEKMLSAKSSDQKMFWSVHNSPSSFPSSLHIPLWPTITPTASTTSLVWWK